MLVTWVELDHLGFCSAFSYRGLYSMTKHLADGQRLIGTMKRGNEEPLIVIVYYCGSVETKA